MVATAAGDSESAARVNGPFPLTEADLAEVNRVFSESFTDRYQRDGLVGVRVPPLNPNVWRFAIAGASGGAMLWRNDEGKVIAFNVAHLSGVEGWMGPLAVAAGYQGRGVGKAVVGTGAEWLKGRGAKVIGLETMPRTMENIGFYSRMGFAPERLTLTVNLEPEWNAQSPQLFSRCSPAEREEFLAECRDLVSQMLPGYDYSREIALTEEYRLGDTLVFHEGGQCIGFGICHSAPLIEGRNRLDVRVLKFVCAPGASAIGLAQGIAGHARRTGGRGISFRVQSHYADLLAALLQAGGTVRWSDLRMSARGYSEMHPEAGVVMSNWEI